MIRSKIAESIINLLNTADVLTAPKKEGPNPPAAPPKASGFGANGKQPQPQNKTAKTGGAEAPKSMQSLASIANHFMISFDKNDRAAALTAISLLLLNDFLTPKEQITGLWLIYNEYKNESIAHPYAHVFRAILYFGKYLAQAKTNKCELFHNSTVRLARAIMNQTAYPLVNDTNKTAADLISTPLTDAETQADKPELYQKDENKPTTIVEKIMKEAMTDHQTVFLETLFVKLLSQTAKTTSLKQMTSMLIDNAFESFDLTANNIQNIFSIIPLLKGGLHKAIAPILLFIKLDDNDMKALENEAFAPLIFFYFLNDKCQPQNALSTLVNFDVFGIILDWVDTITCTFSKKIFTIIALHIQNMIYKCYTALQNPDFEFITSNLLPILCKVSVSQRPMPFSEDEFKHLFCRNKGSRLHLLRAVLPYYAAVCKNAKVASLIISSFSGEFSAMSPTSRSSSSSHNRLTSMSIFSDFLIHAEQLIISGKSIDLKNPEVNAQYSAFKLLQRLCRYAISNEHGNIISLVAGRFQSENVFTDQVQLFFTFVSEFLWSPVFAHLASRIIRDMLSSNIIVTFKFLDTHLQTRFIDIIKIIESTNNKDEIILCFITIARSMISYYFKYESQITELPQFVTFILEECFPRIVHRKFQSKYSKWKVLTMLIEACLDLVLVSPDFVYHIHSNGSFISALLTVVEVGAVAVIPNSIEKLEESNVRVDRTDVKYAVRCETAALYLMQIILQRYLSNKEGLSPLCEIFFDEKNEASGIFATLIGFLEVQLPFQKSTANNDLPLTGSALHIIELLCKIAARKGNISVDAFYPTEKQKIITRCIKHNLLSSNTVSQSVDILDFISSTIMTQPAFSFSFVQLIGSSYMLSAAKQLNQMINHPRLLLSIAKLFAHMWRQLSSQSKVLGIISPDFWITAFPVIKAKYPPNSNQNLKIYKKNRANFILAQSYLLQADLCSTMSFYQNIIPQHITIEVPMKELFSNLIENLKEAKQISRFSTDRFHIKLDRFRSDGHEYGTNFYYDVQLLKWFSQSNEGGKIQDICNDVEEYNLVLSQIDACTHFASSLRSYIQQYARLVSENIVPHTPDAFPNPADILDMLIIVLSPTDYEKQKDMKSPTWLFPESSVIVFVELFESVLLISNSIDDFRLIKPNLVAAFATYLSYRSTPQVFHTLSIIFSCSSCPPDDITTKMRDGRPISEGFRRLFDQCIYKALKEKQQNAIMCAVEIANKLVGDNSLYLSAERQALLLEAADVLLTDPQLGPHFLIAVSILCMNVNTGCIVVDTGLAEKISAIPPPKESKLWPAIFKLLNAIPTASRFSRTFILGSLPTVIYLLGDGSCSSSLHANLTSLLLCNRDIYPEISTSYPNVFNSLMTLIFTRMKKSFSICRDVLPSENEQVLQLETLRNCLMIFNTQLEFPFSEVPGISDNSANRTSAIEFTKMVTDSFGKYITDLKEINEDKSHQHDFKLRIVIFEASARLFCGLVMMSKTKNDAATDVGVDQFLDLSKKVKEKLMSAQGQFASTISFIQEFKLLDSQII